MSMKAEGECFGSLWKIKRHSKQRVVIEPVAHLARGLNRKSPLFADLLINDWQTARTHSQRLHCAPRQKEARTSRSLSPSRNKSLGSSKAHWRRQKLEEILLCHSSEVKLPPSRRAQLKLQWKYVGLFELFSLIASFNSTWLCKCPYMWIALLIAIWTCAPVIKRLPGRSFSTGLPLAKDEKIKL